MSKKKEFLKVYEKKESKKALKRKKLIARILLIIIIIGTISLIGINTFITSSISGIKISADDFEDYSPNNETIVLEGSFKIDNRHWNSIDIRNLEINFEIFTEDDIEIIDKTIKKRLIPRGKATEIEIDLEFKLLELGDKDFNSLETSKEIGIDIEISFDYAFYEIGFKVSLETDLE